MADGGASAETGLMNVTKAEIWTSAAGKSFGGEIRRSVEPTALIYDLNILDDDSFPSVDLQVIVDMSRKYNLAFLKSVYTWLHPI